MYWEVIFVWFTMDLYTSLILLYQVHFLPGIVACICLANVFFTACWVYQLRKVFQICLQLNCKDVYICMPLMITKATVKCLMSPPHTSNSWTNEKWYICLVKQVCRNWYCKKYSNFLWCILCNIQVFLQVQCTCYIQESCTYNFESAFISKIKSQGQLLGIQGQMKIYNMSPLHLCMMFLSIYQDVCNWSLWPFSVLWMKDIVT